MKKILALSTLLIYFTLSVVPVITIHFCYGDVESIALLEKKGGCCEGIHACHTSCCEDLVIEVDFDTDQFYP